ncbi:MAG: hypothetical protein V4568_13155 [Pseudomonadota bacterium]
MSFSQLKAIILSKVDSASALLANVLALMVGIFGASLIVANFVDSLVPHEFLLMDAGPLYENFRSKKIVSLLTYSFCLVGIATALLAVWWCSHERETINNKFGDRFTGKLILLVPISLIVSGVLHMHASDASLEQTSRINMLVHLLPWVFLLGLVFTLIVLTLPWRMDVEGRHQFASRAGIVIGLIYSLVALVSIFAPLIIGQGKVINDFINISETTTLKSGEERDNITFINEKTLFGLKIFDYRKPMGDQVKDIPFSAAIDNQEGARSFIKTENRWRKYFYDENNQMLYSNASWEEEDYLLLRSLVGEKDIANLTERYLAGKRFSKRVIEGELSDDDIEFIQANRYELINQLFHARYFYHHAHMYLPIVKLQFGMQTPNFYGTGLTNTWFAVLQYFNSLNFESYLKGLYLSYAVYVVGLLVLFWVLFRDLVAVIYGAVLVTFSILVQYPIDIVQAPGFAPIRHIWDIPVLILFFYALQGRRLAALPILVLAALSIWWSAEFGLILNLALLPWACIAALQRKVAPRRVAIGAISWLAVCGAVFLIFKPNNPFGKYLLLGVGISETSYEYVLRSVVLLIGCGLLFVWCRPRSDSQRAWALWSITGAIFLYTFGLGIYAIWFPGLPHVAVVIPWFLTFLLLVFWQIPLSAWNLNHQARVHVLRGTLLPVLIVAGLPIAAYSYSQWHARNNSFDTHVLYKWSYPGATFQTTMEPNLVFKTVALIDKYQTRPGCANFLSRYDVLLSTISSRPQCGPYISDIDTLITAELRKKFSDALLSSTNPYLFVDLDIDRPFIFEVPIDGTPLSRWLGTWNNSNIRNVHLFDLLKTFNGIRAKYCFVDAAGLLAVYKHCQ